MTDSLKASFDRGPQKHCQQMWITIGFTMCSLKNIRNHWFHCVFMQNIWKQTLVILYVRLTIVEQQVVLLCVRPNALNITLVVLCGSLKHVETPLVLLCIPSTYFENKPWVLLCFPSAMLINQWFYLVFVQTCWKPSGFIVFSINKAEQPMVLLCFRLNILKHHWF